MTTPYTAYRILRVELGSQQPTGQQVMPVRDYHDYVCHLRRALAEATARAESLEKRAIDAERQKRLAENQCEGLRTILVWISVIASAAALGWVIAWGINRWVEVG